MPSSVGSLPDWLRRCLDGCTCGRHSCVRCSEGTCNRHSGNGSPCEPGCECGRHKGGNLGRKASPETRAKMSAAHLGKRPPPRSEEWRAKHRAIAINRSPEVRENMAAAQRGKKLSEETKAKVSSSLKGHNKGHPAYHGKIQDFTDKRGRNFLLRSSWEVQVAQYLDLQDVSWDYEPHQFDLGDRTYRPDFWIPEWGCYWEVKGWFHERHQQTIRLYRQRYPIPLVVIGKETYRWIVKQFAA